MRTDPRSGPFSTCAARAYWDRQIERKFVPRADDIAKETGLSLVTAREYRALWKLEPRAHALLEAVYSEHGERDTGTLPDDRGRGTGPHRQRRLLRLIPTSYDRPRN